MPSGLDKSARLAEKRAEELAASIPRPLDPPFPYTVEPFDPAFFSLPDFPELIGSASPRLPLSASN